MGTLFSTSSQFTPLAVSHTLRKAPIEALMKQNWAYPGGKKQDGGVWIYLCGLETSWCSQSTFSHLQSLDDAEIPPPPIPTWSTDLNHRNPCPQPLLPSNKGWPSSTDALGREEGNRASASESERLKAPRAQLKPSPGQSSSHPVGTAKLSFLQVYSGYLPLRLQFKNKGNDFCNQKVFRMDI